MWVVRFLLRERVNRKYLKFLPHWLARVLRPVEYLAKVYARPTGAVVTVLLKGEHGIGCLSFSRLLWHRPFLLIGCASQSFRAVLPERVKSSRLCDKKVKSSNEQQHFQRVKNTVSNTKPFTTGIERIRTNNHHGDATTSCPPLSNLLQCPWWVSKKWGWTFLPFLCLHYVLDCLSRAFFGFSAITEEAVAEVESWHVILIALPFVVFSILQ